MTTTYRELVIKGNVSVLKGFLQGFQAARRIKKGLLLCSEHPIQTHHLQDLLKLQGGHIHVIASTKVSEAVVVALQAASKDLELKIVSNRRVKQTRFRFKFVTYSRDVGKELKRTLSRLPVALELYDYKPKERIDPGAAGMELYSPVHDYEFKGEGKVRGELESLLVLHKKLDDHAFIEVEDIEIVQ